MKNLRVYPRHVWLILIGFISVFLDFWNLSQNGYANTYYAAAVKSMLQSFHNFFFLSFDPSGFITIDKPPVGFWIQTLSAWIFGFHGWSILIPEALSGVISVFILYYLISKKHGYIPGLIAAFLLAITPLSVATNRNNTIDSILTTVLLIAAMALLKAIEGGKHRLFWLLTAAGVLGIGFNVKFAEAFLVLPAMIVGYALVKGLKIRTKIMHLFLAACVLTIVSLSWAVIVDAVPAQDRPWVGSTQTNSEINLAFGYDGIQRVTGMHGGNGGMRNFARTAGVSHNFGNGITRNSASSFHISSQYREQTNDFFRLFTGSDAEQVGWWLPLGIVGFVLALLRYRRKSEKLATAGPSVAMWGTWFATTVLYFTFVSAMHTYYMVTMAPAIAAMVGIGFGEIRHYLHHKWKVILGAIIVLVGMAVYQLHLVWSYANLRGIFTALVGIGVVIALMALVFTIVTNHKRLFSWTMVGASLFSMAVIPAYWSYSTLTYAGNGSNPTAGPRVSSNYGNYNFSGGIFGLGQDNANVNEKLLSFLINHYQGRYLLVTQNATIAAPYILDTGLPVMAMGGFRGTDPAITPSQLQTLAKEGKVKYFLISAGGSTSLNRNKKSSNQFRSGFGSGNGTKFSGFRNQGNSNFGNYAQLGGFIGGSSTQSQNINWIEKNCKPVPTAEWEDTATNSSQRSGKRLGELGSAQLYEYVEKTAAK
ncbi:ArnT family glycosyltransferase [Sporolactobacillus pectinivorans]|uniref:ArnT family glycosyltransferase n=1 Tax=Sporolactobacillus pectinivorans TaxID=1591408 RepID=UPI000C25A980|nr:glycosyltransferase family 39 protein [Sporolactobacillus pectinivorans]